MRHFLFEDAYTEEEFIVGANSYEAAFDYALELFIEPHYICELDDYEAEASGLDEY